MSMIVDESAGQNQSNAECHYCGYEIEAASLSGRRCPKCGGTAWSMQAASDGKSVRTRANDGDDPAAPPGLTQVRFELRAVTTQAYIFIRPDGGRRRMIPLRRLRSDRWALNLPLPPQTYHYRFYVDDGEHLLNFDPATSKTSTQHGNDTTLTIRDEAGLALAS